MNLIQHLGIGNIGRQKKTNRGLRRALAPMRDLPTIASFRAVALLRRHGPVPGILAARRPGAIMDKSERPRLTTLNALKPTVLQLVTN